MWNIVPWPGIELGPPASGAQRLNHWVTRKVLFWTFFPIYFPSAVGWLHRCDTSRNIGPNLPHFFIGSSAMSTWAVSTLELLWTIVLWIFVCKFLCGYVFISLGYIPKIETAGSYSELVFKLLRNCHSVLKTDAPFYIPTSNMRVPTSQQPPPHLLPTFLIIAVLVGVIWYLIVIFDLHFSGGQQCWTSIHVLMGLLCIFFREISIQIFYSFWNWVVICLFIIESYHENLKRTNC